MSFRGWSLLCLRQKVISVEITSDTIICILDSKYGIVIAILLALMCIFAALVFKSTKKFDFYNKVSTRNLLCYVSKHV